MNATTNPECPTWPGAAVAYSRAYQIMQELAVAAYRAAQITRKGKRPAPWTLPDDVETLRLACAAGDEETIKAMNHRYIAIWAPAAGQVAA